MLGTIDVVTAVAGPCQECFGSHRFRIALNSPSDAFSSEHDRISLTTHGFFRSCRVTGRRAWFVVTIAGSDGDVAAISPADDDHWEPLPDSDEEIARLARRPTEFFRRSIVTESPANGSRSVAEMMRILRRMLGCSLLDP